MLRKLTEIISLRQRKSDIFLIMPACPVFFYTSEQLLLKKVSTLLKAFQKKSTFSVPESSCMHLPS